MTTEHLTSALKQEALRLGFDLVGVCPAVTPPGLERFRDWLASGHAGQMRYMTDRAAAYEHPSHVLDGARSLLMLAVNYRTVEPVPSGPGQGRVSRYAWGADYHDVIRRRLRRLADFHRRLAPDARVRGVVDTAPLLERDFARLAGLGWIGKNTMLVNRRLGSWLFLAATADQRNARLRRTTAGGPLRHVPGVSRRVSHRRARGRLPSRRPTVHQLLDDRASRRDSGRAARAAGRSALWMRRLPGGLPLESPRAGHVGDRLSTRPRHEPGRSGRVVRA